MLDNLLHGCYTSFNNFVHVDINSLHTLALSLHGYAVIIPYFRHRLIVGVDMKKVTKLYTP